MTTRSQDRPPQGTGPEATKTTQQSMIAAIGASGAVIAGGVTTFVLLVGVVSFDVWPMSDPARPGSGSELTLVELAPEPTVEPPAAAVPFGSGALVTEPATVVLAPAPDPEADAPKLAGGRDVTRGEAPPTPVAQVPGGGGGGEEAPSGGGGTTGAGTEEPIPQEPAEDEPEADQDDVNGRPQRPARPVRPAPAPPRHRRPSRPGPPAFPPPAPTRRAAPGGPGAAAMGITADAVSLSGWQPSAERNARLTPTWPGSVPAAP